MVTFLLLFGATALAGCRAEPAAGTGEIYHIALEHARRQLLIEDTIVVHPLMGRLNRIGPEDGPPINHFNDMDRGVIAAAVHGDARYAICDISGSGACSIESGQISIVLSELHDLGADGEGLVVAVDDRRDPSTRTRSPPAADVAFYGVRLKHGWRGWRVVAFEPVTGPVVPPVSAPGAPAR